MEATSVNIALGEAKKPEDGHGIGFFVSGSIKYPIVEQYEIPSKYNIDTLVLLPVNEHSIFLYWELTGKLLEANSIDPDTVQFIIKVYEIKAVQKKSDDRKQIYSAAVSGRLGEFHATVPDAFKPMSAAIGVEIGGTFRELVESNHVNIPSFAVLGLKDDFFSTGTITLQTEKPKEEEEAFKGQSEAFNKEIEIASQLLDIRSKDTQSIELLMGLLEKFRNFSSEDRALLDIIKRFYEARAEDVRLLQMFLEFLKMLGLKDGNKKSILEYFERLKDSSAASGSSGSLSKDKEAGK